MKVALLHDLTRAVCQAGHHGVAAMWCRLLAPGFAALGHRLDCPAEFAADRPEAVAALMRRCGLAPEPADWARLFSDPALVPEVEVLLDRLEADMVLGWELSPNLVRALLRHGVPVIDMSLAPLRFAPDLFLRLRASRPEWSAALAGLAVPAAAIGHAAGRVRQAVAPAPGPPDRRGSVLFVGQTDLDASLIAGGRLAQVADHLDALDRLLAGGRPLLLKPHPHGERHADIRLLHRRFAQARMTTESIYTLLSGAEVETVATLTSSVAQEAPWFGRDAVALVTPDVAPERLTELSGFHIVAADIAAAGFWDRVLQGGRADLPAAAALPLRRIFQLDWGWPPLPSRPAAVLTSEWHGVGRGQAGEAMLRFGWARPGAQGARAILPLATLAFRVAPVAASAVEIACRATGTLTVGLGLRPGGNSATVALRHDEPCVLRLPLGMAAGGGQDMELTVQLEEASVGAFELTGVRAVAA